ncbi:MAG TPA: helix-turn-helix domain-containing protein [Actinophytocola sp.]|uniref:TetR/AcrR family transcriptional regulator n=1 Tax=Actinophytocola sp. TaxID=1872138 RepID=UPI002DB5C52D|nr:helix-turn-helix domain-containing protein [Actinophytocola sp.]HEU5471457.1 helix-turn-helix domain-containing protein [Actinophytocola sp.]
MDTERRRRMPRAERERQMIAVAEELFAERGYQAAAMDEIADRVGVSKPMLYEYFGSKEGLFVACIRQARADLLAVTTESVRDAASAEDALRAGLVAFFEFTDTHRRAWELLRREVAVAGQAAADELEAIRAQQTALDAALLASYRPDAPARDLEAAAQIIVGACERLSIWYVQQEDVSAKQAAEYVMDLLWYGLRDRLGSPT